MHAPFSEPLDRPGTLTTHMICRGVFGSLVAGLIAGIWGVTGWGGFLYYLAMQIVVSISPPIYITSCVAAALKPGRH